LHAALPGSLVRQPCPAALSGSLVRQPFPAALQKSYKLNNRIASISYGRRPACSIASLVYWKCSPQLTRPCDFEPCVQIDT
jgi:hypothetical protein